MLINLLLLPQSAAYFGYCDTYFKGAWSRREHPAAPLNDLEKFSLLTIHLAYHKIAN